MTREALYYRIYVWKLKGIFDNILNIFTTVFSHEVYNSVNSGKNYVRTGLTGQYTKWRNVKSEWTIDQASTKWCLWYRLVELSCTCLFAEVLQGSQEMGVTLCGTTIHTRKKHAHAHAHTQTHTYTHECGTQRNKRYFLTSLFLSPNF